MPLWIQVVDLPDEERNNRLNSLYINPTSIGIFVAKDILSCEDCLVYKDRNCSYSNITKEFYIPSFSYILRLSVDGIQFVTVYLWMNKEYRRLLCIRFQLNFWTHFVVFSFMDGDPHWLFTISFNIYNYVVYI